MVITMNLLRGISKSIFLRLWTLAPFMEMNLSFLIMFSSLMFWTNYKILQIYLSSIDLQNSLIFIILQVI